jgi:hypothetical protein
MTPSEIVELVRQVNATWPNNRPVPPEALPIWHEDLADQPTEYVRAAFAAYRRLGREFPPSAAELRRLATELVNPVPTFEQTWAAIATAIRRWGIYRPEPALAELARLPLAVELVQAMGGWQQVCLGGTDEYRPTDPGVWRSQAEHAFRALVEQDRLARAVADLPPPHSEPPRHRLEEAVAALAKARSLASPPLPPKAQEVKPS